MRRLCALLIAVAAFAVPSAQQPAFRSSTDLVEVDVVVRDKNGAFVADLSVADFELLDEGKPRVVQDMYLRLTTDGGWKDAGRTANESAPPADALRRTFVVLFDEAHLSSTSFKHAQSAAQALFTKYFQEGDLGGVVANGRMANNRLSADKNELVRAVKAVQPGKNSIARIQDENDWPRMTEAEAMRVEGGDRSVEQALVLRACSDDQDRCNVDDPRGEVRNKASHMTSVIRAEAQQIVGRLTTLMNGLEKIPGRKTIILLSDGFLADDTWPQVRVAVSLASRVNARIYTLDARGLNRGLASIDSTRPGESTTRMLEQMDMGADSTNSLAVDTGGFVVRNSNQFDRAMRLISEDSGNYYVLGYAPENMDGKFHRVTVRVKRPNVAVRARRGYAAVPRPVQANRAAPPSVSTSVPVTHVTGTEVETIAPAELPAVPEILAEPTIVAGASTANASAIRVRPDAIKHVDMLLTDPSADQAAAAGWDAYQRGDVAAARISLSVAAAKPGALSWIHYALGQSDYALRQYADAVTAWEHVRTLAPDFEPVYFDLVDGYLQLKTYDKAIRLLRDAAARWPKDPDVFNALGVVHTTRGALDDAIKAFEEAKAAEPNEPTTYFNLGRAMELHYIRSRHYVPITRKWTANERDREAAIENYERYLTFGGPYADAAKAALTRLNWAPK